MSMYLLLAPLLLSAGTAETIPKGLDDLNLVRGRAVVAGGHVSGDAYQLESSYGQWDSGAILQADGMRLEGGFWPPERQTTESIFANGFEDPDGVGGRSAHRNR